jgi:dTMP kinase
MSADSGHPLFITVEGLEGAGKTTCLSYIRDWFHQRGVEPLMTREPGGTELGEAVRGLLLDHRFHGMNGDTETLLVFAARAEHLARVIRPALESGRWVVCDRFTDATYAYQGIGRGVGSERVAVLEDWVQRTLRPDLTLYLDVTVEIGLGRAAQRSDPDRFESERAAFFNRVRSGYLERCKAEPERMRLIDASQSVEDVQQRIGAELQRLMERQAHDAG